MITTKERLSWTRFSLLIPSQYQEVLQLIALFAHVRLAASWKPDHLEEAIYRIRNWLPWIPHENPFRFDVVDFLMYLQSMHFEDVGLGPSRGAFIRFSVLWPAIILGFDCISWIPLDGDCVSTSLHTLVLRMSDIAEIEEAIEPCRLLLASFHPCGICRSAAVCALGGILLRAFWFTNNIEYVNEAISILQESLNSPNAKRFGVALLLIRFLSIRFDSSRSREVFGEIMRLFQMAVGHRGVMIRHPQREMRLTRSNDIKSCRIFYLV